MNGAGGTNGGSGKFIIGFIMFCTGLYLLLTAISVNSGFSMSTQLLNRTLFGSFNVSLTSGMVIIPFMFGVGMIFYNAKNIIGWLLSIASLSGLIFGIISTLNFSIKSMNAYELLTMIVLLVGGLGLFLSSLRETK